MAWISELNRKFRMLRRRDQLDRDLQDEMRLHLELRQRKSGEAARRDFGNELLLREESREAWGWEWLDRLSQDVRYGARTMLRAPGFTAVAVIALALGIGANTAIFSVVNAVLLRPLAYREPQQLVTILHGGRNPVAAGNYVDWREQSRSFDGMGAADYWTPNLFGAEHPEHLWGLKVTQSLLPLLGVPPLLGRLFLPGEDQVGSEHEVILGYRLWQRRFNGDPAILGQAIPLNGESYTVVGVMPPDFQFAPFWATRAELWVPNALGNRIHERSGNSLRVFARLKPGVSLAQARSEMAAITARLDQQYPASNRNVQVTPLMENVVGKVEAPMLVLMGAVGLVLLIACANVAHMLLARAAARQREIAVRAALGARRLRMIRQFLTESLMLASLGAAAGLLLAYGGVKALVALSPPDIPRLSTVAIDAHVALYLLGIAVLTGIVFGLAPALHASAANLTDGLKAGGRGGSDSIQRNRVRSFLVASEFALALMLLIGAGLMIRSFLALQSIDAGFNPHHLLSMVVSVGGSKEAPFPQRSAFYPQLVERVKSIPGVQMASGINHLPLIGDLWGWSFVIEGRPTPRPGEAPNAVYRIAMPGYFQTMGLPILRGRDISVRDDASAPGVVAVNERAVHDYWPGEDPLGKRISYDSGKTWLSVIAVVKDAAEGDWAAKPQPEVYLAAMQDIGFLGGPGSHQGYITLVVRTAGNPADLASTVQNTVWSIDRNLPISDVVVMDSVVERVNASARFEMLLLAFFGAVALVLSAVGIYGVMSYSVSRRSHELGIRISLGASRGDVLRLVMRQGMQLAAAGSAIGLVGALVLSRLMGKLLYGVQPTDPVTFAGVVVVLGVVALLATYIPARRATRIDPIIALRCE